MSDLLINRPRTAHGAPGLALHLLWLALGTALPATAQVRLAFDAGMGTDHDVQGANVLVAPSLAWAGPWWSIDGDGRYAARGEAGNAFRGALSAAAWEQLFPGFVLEAGGGIRNRSRSWAADASGWTGHLALRLESARRGLRLELGRGRAQGQAAHVPLSSTQGTAWARFGRMELEITGRQTTLGLTIPGLGGPDRGGGDTLGSGPPIGDSIPVEQFSRYTDLGGTLRASHGALSASAALGHRFSTSGAGGWWRLEGLWWMTSRLGLVLQGGRSPPDLLLGGGGGQFFTFALRASLRGNPMPASRHPTAPSQERALLLTRRPGGGTAMAIRAPGAARVELMADFTDWASIDLVRREAGWFELDQAIPRGTHPVNVRYDGGAWTPPPGIPTLHDEFDGVVGVIRVE